MLLVCAHEVCFSNYYEFVQQKLLDWGREDKGRGEREEGDRGSRRERERGEGKV